MYELFIIRIIHLILLHRSWAWVVETKGKIIIDSYPVYQKCLKSKYQHAKLPCWELMLHVCWALPLLFPFSSHNFLPSGCLLS